MENCIPVNSAVSKTPKDLALNFSNIIKVIFFKVVIFPHLLCMHVCICVCASVHVIKYTHTYPQWNTVLLMLGKRESLKKAILEAPQYFVLQILKV